MVQLGEDNPSVGIIGCFQPSGTHVRWQGFKYPKPVLTGREMCHRVFLGGGKDFGFGSLTSIKVSFMTTHRLTPGVPGTLMLCLVLASCSSSTTGSAGNGGGAQSQSYTTDFPLTEAVISESGKWISGGTTGVDWNNVQTTTNFAFGTPPTGQYTDPTAVLTGTWAADQTAQATVRIKTVNASCCHEVELRLRTTIAPHSITGYEINCSVATGNLYMQVVRWNGPLNSFTYVATSPTGCADGDVLKATIVGSTITVYKNGVQIVQGTDSNYASGAPGIGFYETDNNVGYYGFSSFTASDATSQSAQLMNGPFQMHLKQEQSALFPFDGFEGSMRAIGEKRQLQSRLENRAAACATSKMNGIHRYKAAALREASCVV